MFGDYPTHTVAKECVVTRDYMLRVFLQSMVNDLAHITPGVIKNNCINDIPGATYVNKKTPHTSICESKCYGFYHRLENLE